MEERLSTMVEKNLSSAAKRLAAFDATVSFKVSSVASGGSLALI